MEYSIMTEDGEAECIICFDKSDILNKVHPIEKYYIMPNCGCTYNVHANCLKQWQQQQIATQININGTRELLCLYCNSPVTEINKSWCSDTTILKIKITCLVVGLIIMLLILFHLMGLKF